MGKKHWERKAEQGSNGWCNSEVVERMGGGMGHHEAHVPTGDDCADMREGNLHTCKKVDDGS